jgi:predicted kinase
MPQSPESSPKRPCLHFFCGRAGAGKSTLAKTVAADEAAVLICEDVWLARLYGDQMETFEDYRRLSLRLWSVVEPLAIQILQAGCPLVLDFPANNRAARARFRALVDKAAAAHVLHFADSPPATCLERIGRRNMDRPEGSHRLTPEQFEHISSFFEPPAPDESFEVRRYASEGP